MVASAVGICSKVKIVKQMRYTGFLPNVSDNGARTSGPTPSITTNPVWQPMTLFFSTLKESAILSIPGENMELAKGLRTRTRSKISGTEGEMQHTSHTANNGYVCILLPV